MTLKDGIRFAVKTKDGRHSCIWRLLATPKNDVYIGTRNMMGSLKISLHQSGIGRVAMPEEYYQKLVAIGKKSEEADRKLFGWKQPLIPNNGATHLGSIHILTNALSSRPFHPKEIKKKVFWFEPEDNVGDVEFGFFGSRQHPESISGLSKIGTPTFYVTLDNGTHISIIMRAHPKTEIPKTVSQEPKIIKGGRFEDLSVGQIRDFKQFNAAFLMNDPNTENGVFKVWDIHTIEATKDGMKFSV